MTREEKERLLELLAELRDAAPPRQESGLPTWWDAARWLLQGACAAVLLLTLLTAGCLIWRGQ